jgi:hypothetical protein
MQKMGVFIAVSDQCFILVVNFCHMVKKKSWRMALWI